MNRKLVPAVVLVLLALVMFVLGLDATTHGRVAGGNMIWVLYFGGCGLLWICAFLVVRRSNP